MGIFNFFAKKSNDLNKLIDAAKVELALYFSQEIVDNAVREFNIYCRIEGLSITTETDFGKRAIIAQAKDADELFVNIIKEITRTCAENYELINREINSKKWHYVRANAVDGHWMYKENSDYRYDAIEDTRKIYFEKHIGAMAKIFSLAEVDSLIAEYTTLMNCWFADSHWEYNSDLMEFVEISSSKERDTEQKEHPQPDEILK